MLNCDGLMLQESRAADGRGQRRGHPILRCHGRDQKAGDLLQGPRAAAGSPDHRSGADSSQENRLNPRRVQPMYDVFALRGRVKATSEHPRAHPPTPRLTTWIAGSSTRGSAVKDVRLQECGNVFLSERSTRHSWETDVTNEIH